MTINSNLKWGLIGYGDLADKRVAAALQHAAGSQLIGIWGRSPQKAKEFASKHNIPSAHATLNELLQSDIDAVYVCTPPDSHCEYTLVALAAGKHVLVEKPMAASVDECRRMVEAARNSGLTLGVAYYRRSFPKMQRIKQLIEEGVLGEPTWANIVSHSWFAPQPTDQNAWRVQKSRSGGGGAVADIGVHRLDLLDYWLGPSRVVHRSLQHLVQPYEVEDGSSIVLELQNGAPVHAYFAWNSKTWIDRFEIVGSEGKIIAEPLDTAPLTVIRGREREDLEIAPPANLHQPCIEDFVQSVSNKRSPLCDGEAGLRTNQLLSAIVS